MSNKINEEKVKEIWSYFKKTQPVYLATSDKSNPRVRPVTLIYFKHKFWVATGSEDAKMAQIKSNSNFEFCYSITDGKDMGYIRGSGKIDTVTEIKTKKELLENIEFIQYFWKDPADQGYTLLKLNI
ncbi:MAG: pyridoxamine 5'-phosphate oxidase family protein [Candidatus Cloacimonetes bacterium]|nr:pyridoxamine 5'-phosphate oxidase family protein [Candidatus Cloacimonadota bacterium]